MGKHDKYAKNMQKALLAYSDLLKEDYSDLPSLPRFDPLSESKRPTFPSLAGMAAAAARYACPNCAEIIRLEFQAHEEKHLYYVRFRCNMCQFGSIGYFTYEALASLGSVERMILEFVKELLDPGVDLLERTECELENEWVTRSEDDDDFPF